MIADFHRPIPIRTETQTLPPVATILVPASPSISNDSIAGQPDDDEEEEIDELADDNSIIPSRRTSRAVSRRVSTKAVDSQVDELADDDTLVDMVVNQLTRGVGVDPFEYIIKEKLDEKEAMMLDVPELPPPNVSRTEAPQPAPESLADLMDLSKDGQGATGAMGIRRIGGIKPLQIELGWRVTIPGEPLTLEQAIGVQNPTDPDAKSVVKEFRAGLNEVQEQERSFEVEQPGEDVKGVGRGEAWARDGMILAREEREKVYGRRPSEQVQSLDPLNEESEVESRFDENEKPLPNIELGTQASFVPLSFGTHGPQSQWDEPPYPELEPRPYPSSTEEQPVGYRHSWVDDSGYYDQEMEVEVTEGEDDRYWFQILSQSSAGQEQQNGPVPATEFELAPGAEEQAYGAKEAFTVPMDIGPEVRAIEVLDSLEPGRRVGAEEGIGAREYPREVDSTPATDVDSRALATQEPEPPIPNPSFVRPEHSAPNKLAAFMYARAKTPALLVAPPVAPPREFPLPNPAPGEQSSRPVAEKSELYPIPPEIRSLITLSPDESPKTSHEPEPFRVLASMQLVQHRALVSALEHPSIELHLVERSSSSSLPGSITWPWQDTSTPLHGASLALDPNTALVFIPLADLASPDAVPALSRLLQSLLTRFEWIGLVLEAYPRPRPRSHTLQPESASTSTSTTDRDDFTLDPFTPPTLKALSALRRALVLLHNALGLVPIAGTGGVEVGIGRNVQETARVVRCAVDRAVESWRGREGRAGEVWGGREWVEDVDESMEEQELANVPGMNVFAAVTVLAQTTVDDLLSMSAEERTRLFGPSITESKVAALNDVIAQGQARVEMIGQERELGATEEGA
ncbi:hypothetical protein FRC12_008878 [Ceratobasidium sp. 428]|nr:hypothetical protein FRC12_008878 [Ceratobasidium sp. 428]